MTESPKIGERALQMMNVVKDLEVFKVPKVPEKKKRKSFKILDEDSYIQNMSKIIQRDFFPDLEKLNAQNEYLEAEQNKDIEKMRQLYMKYSSGRPPSERFSGSSAVPSPATFETPLDVRREESEPLNTNSPTSSSIRSDSSDISRKNTAKESSSLSKDAKQGLDDYLSVHTSEDNASFSEIMEKSIANHRNKHSWQYKDESDFEKDREERLALPQTVEEQIKKMEQPKPLSLDTWTYKNKNFIMFVPDGVQRTPEEEVNLAKRRQEIIHSNTRFTKSPFDERENQEQIKQIAHSQAHTLDGKIGVDGKELNLTDLPSVNGFSFVPTPSPKPGVCESPIMTWGEIEGTPFRLDGQDTPRVQHGASILAGGPSFRIAEPAKRERLAHALADKAANQRNSKQGNTTPLRKLLRTPTPTNTFDRLETMSPAARKLATSKIRSLGSDRGLRASYSPSPSRRSEERVPFSPRKGLINELTPILNNASKKETNSIISLSPKLSSANNNTFSNDLTPSNSDNVTTDNLLNLPTRAKAVDFF